MAKNSNLHAAKAAKNDEFYTQLTDIEKEMAHYREHFRGKVIFCNCDDPTWSNFWRYFHLNFGFLGLKKLIATHYNPEAPTYKLEYEGGDDYNIEAGVRTDLMQNGDFRSDECIELLKECDIVVTNPPFSLFREYVAQLVECEKKFIIIGNINAITYKEFFPLLKNNEVWMGMSIHSGDREFRVPDYYDTRSPSFRQDEYGNKYVRVVGVRWYTNLDHPKRHEPLTLFRRYADEPERFPKYDNYDAINVDKTVDIPCDYDGVMGVPISFLDKYCPEQFEIVSFRKGDDGKDLVFTREREREFNRTFESLFDGVDGSDYGCEADDLQRRKESVCSRSDTTADMKFFAEYICARPELVKIALAERERESRDVLRQCNEPAERTCQRLQNQWSQDICASAYQTTLNLFFRASTALPGVIKNAEGKIHGKPTYARILIRRRR